MGTIVGLGRDSSITIGRESTYATAPGSGTPMKLELVSAEITPRLSVIEDPSMSNTQASRRFIGQGGQYYEASFKVRVNYEGMEELWRMFLGTYTSAVVDTTARDHTFKEKVALESYTIDFSIGNVPAGKVTRLLGFFGTELRLTGQAAIGEGGMVMADIKGLAKTLSVDVTPATGMTGGAFPTAIGVIFHQALLGVNELKDGSANTTADIRLRSFDLTLSRPHDPNRFYFGSVNPDKPVPNGPLDATWQFEQEWNDITLLQNAMAATPTGLLLTLRHPTVVGSTTAKREFELKANSPMPAEYGKRITGVSAILQTVSYRLQYNTTDASLIVLRTRNALAALPA